MKPLARLFAHVIVMGCVGLMPTICFAGPDDYVGDSSIYVGSVADLARPNVLFVLDTSLSSLNAAGSGGYESPFTCSGGGDDPTATCSVPADPASYYPVISTADYPSGFVSNEIYQFSVTGVWTRVGTSVNPFYLNEVVNGGSPCVGSRTYDDGGSTVTDYKNLQVYLAEYGTYAGTGEPWFPGFFGGSCDTTSSKGGSYATGDYLNFVYRSVVSASGSSTAAVVLHAIPGNKFGFFRALKQHTILNPYISDRNNAACAVGLVPNGQCSEPVAGNNADLYWARVGNISIGKTASNTPDLFFFDDTSTVPAIRYYIFDLDGNGAIDPATEKFRLWTSAAGTLYTGPTAVAGYETQREVFYQAIETVITAQRAKINFGVMVYNPAIQGAVLIEDGAGGSTHVQDLRLDTDRASFLNLLPKGVDPTETVSLTDPLDYANYVSNPSHYSIADGEGPPTISAGPQRPLAEALYDAGHYFGASYPGTKQYIGEPDTIADAPDPYNTVDDCDYNHIILISNGLPNGESTDATSFGAIGTGGDFDGDGVNETVYGQGTHYLDDVAGYLHVTDDMTIYTILAYQSFDELLNDAAIDGGSTGLYLANSPGELADALNDIISNIVAEKDTAFVAPVVPASTTNRTISSNRVYLGLFKPQTKEAWHGNVKKYQVKFGAVDVLADINGNDATDSDGDFIETSKSYWGSATVSGAEKIFSADPANPQRDLSEGDGGIVDAGGVGGSLKALPSLGASYGARDIFTYLSGTKTELRDSSTSPATYNVTPAQVGLVSTDTSGRDKLVDWIYGYDAYNSSNRFGPRDWLMGDVLHSKPLVFNYEDYDTETMENVCTDVGSGYNSSVIFVGGNDGMMHAFRDCDGKELWGFVPPLLLNRLKLLPGTDHLTMVDGAPTLYVHDSFDDGNIDSSQGDRVVLLFGLRRGGGNNTLDDDGDLNTQVPRGAYYALDVTDPLQPTMLWEITSNTTGYEELAETWSQPRLGLLKDSTGAKWVVAIVGAGYDQNEDLRWGNRVLYPPGTDHTTDTTEITNDGGYTDSAPNGQPYNPRGRGIFAIKVAKLQAQNIIVGPDTFSKSVPNFTDSGNLFWKFTYGGSNTSTAAGGTSTAMEYSFPTDIAALDLNGDNLIDRLYASDMDGNMWRFDDDGNPETFDLDGGNVWSARIIFYSNSGYSGSFDVDGNYTATPDPSASNRGRKIFYKPAVTLVSGNPVLYFGTGDREHPLNFNVKDRIYALIDRGQNYSTSDAYPPLESDNSRDEVIKEDDLVDLTDDPLQNGNLNQVNGALTALEADTNFGWYIRLENTGEKSLAPPVVFAGQVFYTTYAPNLIVSDPCELGNLGVSRLYHLNFKTGEAVNNYDSSNDSTDPSTLNERAVNDSGEVLLKTDRIKTLGEGIPSGIVPLIDASGKVTMMISASNRVGTYSAPDTKLITPVYYRQWSPE